MFYISGKHFKIGTRKSMILEQEPSHKPAAITEIIFRPHRFFGFLQVSKCKELILNL